MHRKIHLDDVCFDCTFCGKKYGRQQDVTLHLKRYHPNLTIDQTNIKEKGVHSNKTLNDERK